MEKHERFLTREELHRLGEALRVAPAERLASVHAAAAIRLLVLTGCRRNEILCLRWDDLNFDAGEMRLPDSKTGARTVPMASAAADVLKGLPRTPDSPWVFPGKKKGTRLVNLNDSWDRVRRRAGLDGVRLHDLRHTFASRALALGEGLPMIGDLLGHRTVNTTARYAHLARDSVRDSSAKIAADIGARIMPSNGR
ncbi:MAG: site-specific integrase [Proteobacteria bacterium]|nr:site-specific integrase [Pseudomonadota bacterium]